LALRSRRARQSSTTGGMLLDSLSNDVKMMRLAIAEARSAEAAGEVPVGAVIVSAAGDVIAFGGNLVLRTSDPTAHAEIVSLRAAGMALENYRLVGCTLYSTLEPCAMCAGAILHARVARLVYAAADPKAGACGSVLTVMNHPALNHRVEMVGGVLGEECGAMLTNFFRARRLSPLSRPRWNVDRKVSIREIDGGECSMTTQKATAKRTTAKAAKKSMTAPARRWSSKVDSDSTHPDHGLFLKSARAIADALATKAVSPKGPVSGMRMLNFYINRAGDNLTKERVVELEKAKELLSGIIAKQKVALATKKTPTQKAVVKKAALKKTVAKKVIKKRA
jgi:tRNA(Arg) A34 adenosine deaminase TadA